MRAALGAGRLRLVRQLLTESLTLSLLGAAAGLLLACWIVPLVCHLYPDALPRLDEATLDARVLLFTIVVSLAVGILSGILPALQLSRTGLVEALKEGSSAGGAGGHRLRDGLVVSEVAMAMVLLVGAGLLADSFRRLSAVDLGFDPKHVLAVPLTLPESRYGQGAPETARFYRSGLEKIESLPGVEVAGASMVNPLRGPRPANQVGRLDARERSEFVPIQWRAVTPGYFRAMGIPVLGGRTFDQTDRVLTRDGAAEPVAVISARLARRLWPGGNTVGEHLRWNRPGGTVLRVIGVVGDVNDVALESDAPMTLYFSHDQLAWPHMTLLVRTKEEPGPLAAAVRRALLEVDPLAPADSVFPLERSVAEAAAGQRLNSQLSSGFAFLALAMACLGLYGVTSYSVFRRTREIGVRMALGASAHGVVGLVLRQGARLVAMGMALGAAGALGLTRYLTSILYQTRPTDPATFLGMGVLLCAVGVVASGIPALRAARVDPAEALRAE
jgi:putative ABC transport system permease protein